MSGRRGKRGPTRKQPKNVRHLLLTGIPATGKTCIGKYLHDTRRFKHVDFETHALFGYMPDGFNIDRRRMREVAQERRDFIITWGFLPDTQLRAVLELRELAFEWIWFDGDRTLALTKYLGLGRSRPHWDRQLDKIEQYIDPRIHELAPRIVDPFDAGDYRPLEELAAEIVHY